MKVSKAPPKPQLQDYGFVENDHYYWWASWYAKVLGYKSLRTLKPVVQKAKKVCVQLGIPYEHNFIAEHSDYGSDIKLSKFGCFLIALQADGRKPVVRRARTFFLNELEDLNILLKGEEYIDRMVGKEEIKSLNRKLVSSARRAHVKDFQYFINEGYLGMYNKTMSEIKESRGIDAKSDLRDFMSTTELAANIFRISLTTERLKKLRNPSEAIAAQAHWKIGSQIRDMIIQNTGTFPENQPLATDLKTLQKKLKATQKILNKEVSQLS